MSWNTAKRKTEKQILLDEMKELKDLFKTMAESNCYPANEASVYGHAFRVMDKLYWIIDEMEFSA